MQEEKVVLYREKESQLDMALDHWLSIQREIFLAFTRYADIFYKITILDHDPGTIQYYHLTTKWREMIERMGSCEKVFRGYSFMDAFKTVVEDYDDTLLHIFEMGELFDYLSFVVPSSENTAIIQPEKIDSTFRFLRMVIPFVEREKGVVDNLYQTWNDAIRSNVQHMELKYE